MQIKQMKQIAIVGVLIVVALICCGCAQSKLSSGQRVTDQSNALSVEVPKGWKLRPSVGTISSLILMGPGQEGFNPNLSVMEGDAGRVTLPVLEDATLKGIAISRGFHLISKKDVKLDGADARALEYTVEGGFAGKTLHYRMVFTIRNGKAYYLTCASLDKYYSKEVEAFDFMLDSVKWVK